MMAADTQPDWLSVVQRALCCGPELPQGQPALQARGFSFAL
jgi:hypothetical protein